MFSFSRITQSFPLRTAWFLLFMFPFGHLSLTSQVRDIPVEKKADIMVKNSIYSTDGHHALKDASIHPGFRNTRDVSILPIPHCALLKQKLEVNVSKEFRNRKINIVVQKFEQLMSNQIADAANPSEKVFSGFSQHIALATSGFWEREGFWKAHLQRADYELISSELSLNDINRFQFRKNRKNGDSLPIQPVAGVGRIKITD